MWIRGRSCIAAFMACAILLLLRTPAYPSYNTEAGHKYAIACQRLTALRKSPKKKKYRSYWIDCIRTFEVVEKKYPRSPSAGDACFDRAGIYQDLFLFNKRSNDLDESLHLNDKCQSSYPKHARAPEALFHVVELSLGYKKDNTRAIEAYSRLSQLYPESTWTARANALINPTVRKSKKYKQEPEFRKSPEPIIVAAGKGKPEGVIKSIRFW